MALYYTEIGLFLASYLLGSIPFGKIISHSYGIDIQRRGSGNIGFANVRRVVGWRAGIITLAADITKGFLPVFIAKLYINNDVAFLVGLCAIFGHLYPLWLRFRGGKGIATGLGVVLALQPIAGLIGAAVYCVSCFMIRVSSRSSLLGLIATAAVGFSMTPANWWQYGVLIMIALWTLRHNLKGEVPDYDT